MTIIGLLIGAICFLLALSFLVFFHELGHYSVARFFGVAVDRFSIGFGKPIFRWTSKAGVDWRISRIPLGGYVKFAGDAGAASNPDQEQLDAIKAAQESDLDAPPLNDIFHFKPVWQRMLIVLAGPVANFVLAGLIFAAAGLAFGKESYVWVVGEVTENMPGEEAGIQPGDRITAIDGRAVKNLNDIIGYISIRSGTPIVLSVENTGQSREVEVTPKRMEVEDAIGAKVEIGRIGISAGEASSAQIEKVGLFEALPYGFSQVGDILRLTLDYIKRIFTGKENGKQFGSVLKMGTITSKVAVDTFQADVPIQTRIGAYFNWLLVFSASISIALGVANLMPLPVLDGGHLLYYSYEAVSGRPLSQQKQEFGYKIGFAVLLTLFVVLTINDIGYLRSIDFS